MAQAIGSAPIVNPPTASTDQAASRSADNARGPMTDRPSGLIVVMRASMYSEDCRPDANVNVPRFADRTASRSSRWSRLKDSAMDTTRVAGRTRIRISKYGALGAGADLGQW